MMMRTLRLASLVAASLVVAAVSLGAQQIPGTAAKNAARRVVAATDAHISAMQNTDAPTQAPASPTRVADASHGARQPNHTSPVPVPAAAATAERGRAPANHAHAGAKGRDTVTLSSQQGPNGDGTTSISERGGKNEIALMRESYTYDADGRRDPFVSLIASGELRPMISDLRLVVVIYDPAGRSVAILRDVSTKEQYRVKTGQTLGRMRVSRIDLKSVTFTLEEFGYSRQETLALNDSTRARSQ
jgi:hypothetical protein